MPGGAADKAGNRHERLWIVLRVLDLLEGKARRIRWEPPGAIGVGVEWALEEGGAVWVEQAKDTAGRWTVTKLINEGILSTAKTHIDQGRQFRLLTSSGAEELETLAYRARKSGSFAEYEEFLGEGRRADLDRIAARWGVTAESAWPVLQAIEVEHHTVNSLERIIGTGLRFWYAGNAAIVWAVLERFFEQHIHEYITAARVVEHLESLGLRQQPRAGDTSVISQLRKSRLRHQVHVKQLEPPGGLAPTGDVDAVVEMLRDPDGKQIVVVEGRAGSGKSTVAAAAAAALEEGGWCVGAVRLDVAETMLTSDALGRAMELTESPSVQLAVASDGQPALLVVDQLDAVSLLSGRVPDSFDAVNDVLLEIERYPNVKVLLACRTVDLENDQRLGALRHGERVGRHAVSELDIETVKAHLAACGIDPPDSGPTIELLRTPLHLSLFIRLSDDGRSLRYVTLQQLFARYTQELRSRVGRSIGSLDWAQTAGAMVDYMSREGTVAAPDAVLDEASQQEVEALVSESVIVRHGAVVTFFHESYFDYLFAVSFVGASRDLRAFLADSDQGLFRRAQTRQVLEHLAATDRQRFISVVVELLEGEDIRFHLKVVVVGVLRQIEPEPGHWAALEHLAWNGSPLGARLLRLLCNPGWFDAADSLGRWEAWLEDPQQAETARDELAIVAKHRPARVAELVRPRLEDSEPWRHCLQRIMWLSLCSELVDLIADAITIGLFDDADRPAGGFGFWMNLHRFKDDDPASAARLIGAFLDRGLKRAKLAGSDDPFKSGHLRSDSQSESEIADVARKAPAEFIRHVLPFVIEVAGADLHHPQGGLPVGRWHGRLSLVHGVDNVVFASTEKALLALAEQDPAQCVDALALLRSTEIFELRYLACRALANLGDPDDAVSWLVSDQRNLMLGSGGVSKSAARELIEQCSPGCSTGLFDALEVSILDHWPSWETDESRGYSQYELLAALDATRLSPPARQRLHELKDRFPDWQPQPLEPAGMSGWASSPIHGAETEHMSDDDWIAALKRYTGDEPRWDGEHLVGGARQLASLLGECAKGDPERFSRIALRFDEDIPEVAMNEVIRMVEGHIGVEVLTDLCEHAHSVYGSKVGRAVCSAIGRADAVNSRLVDLLTAYASDPDPEREEARTEAFTGDYLFGGDFLTAGLNSTRGQAALSAARLLFRSADHVVALMPTVAALTQDVTVAVRVCAAEAVTALLNHAAPQALDLAESMFNADIAVLDAQTSERLLTYAVVRDPNRFALTLAKAIAGSEDIAVRGGRIWAVTRWSGQPPAGLDTDVRALPAAARRGAVEAFASNVANSLEDLRRVFDDDDPEVQANLGIAIHRLNNVPASEMEGLIDALTASSAFPQHTLTASCTHSSSCPPRCRPTPSPHASASSRSPELTLQTQPRPARSPVSTWSPWCCAYTVRETEKQESAASTSSTGSQSSTCMT